MSKGIKQKVVWLLDKGKNTIERDEVIPDLLNTVAGWRDPANKPEIMALKDFSSPTMSIAEKMATLKPAFLPVECELAQKLGIPLTLYCTNEAKQGDAPSKGEPNMIAMLLTRKLEDGKARSIRGKALLCLESESGGLDLPVELIVKLLFFTADVLKDTVGHLTGDDLSSRLENAALFFQFYGPGRHVVDGMGRMLVGDPSNPAAPPQSFNVAALKEQQEQMRARQMAQQMQGQRQQMPAFMMEPHMQDAGYLGELRDIVLRGWTPPSTTGDMDEDGPAEKEDANEPEDKDGSLDFSDLG